jgi:hypothetical protein
MVFPSKFWLRVEVISGSRQLLGRTTMVGGNMHHKYGSKRLTCWGFLAPGAVALLQWAVHSIHLESEIRPYCISYANGISMCISYDAISQPKYSGVYLHDPLVSWVAYALPQRPENSKDRKTCRDRRHRVYFIFRLRTIHQPPFWRPYSNSRCKGASPHRKKVLEVNSGCLHRKLACWKGDGLLY